MDLPAFRVRPKNVLNKLGELFLQTDNMFDDYPEFLEKYKVTGNNTSDIKYAIKPEVIDFLNHKLNWCMEGNGPYLIIYQKNKRQRINNLMHFYKQGAQVCRWMLFSDKNDYV